MTTVQIGALIWLAVVFGVSLWQHINLGLIMIPASFILAQCAGIPLNQLYAAFPAKLVILVLGVMYLWNHVQESGFANIIVKKAVSLAGGRVYLLPWIIHVLTAIICAVGALPAAAFAITVPVALEIAKRERISPTLMGIVLIQGACVGGFTPFNPWGSLVADLALKANIPLHAGYLFLFQGIIALAVGILAFFAFGGMELLRRPVAMCEPLQEGAANGSVPENACPSGPLTAYQIASCLGMLLFIVLVLVKFDVGLTAFAIGMVLQIAFRITSKAALSKLPWGIAIMISGVLIYVGLLEKMGVLHAIGEYLVSMEHASLVRFGVSIVGTIIANFESSSIAVLGLVIPVAVKSMAGATSALWSSLQLGVLSGSLVVMCASPFHIGGALILAEAEDYDRTFKELMIWVLVLTLVLPFLAFLL